MPFSPTINQVWTVVVPLSAIYKDWQPNNMETDADVFVALNAFASAGLDPIAISIENKAAFRFVFGSLMSWRIGAALCERVVDDLRDLDDEGGWLKPFHPGGPTE